MDELENGSDSEIGSEISEDEDPMQVENLIHDGPP